MIRMLSRSAITKLKVILIMDLLVVAFAAGAYHYLSPQFESAAAPLKPAEFQVTDLVITPAEAGVDQSIIISVNVTNVGEEEGSYSVDLTINDVVKETKTIQLLGGESEVVNFIDTESNKGSYSVEIEGLTGTFMVTDTPTTHKPATFVLSDLIMSPDEGWVNNPIRISVKVSNVGDEWGIISLDFTVDGEVTESKTYQIPAGVTRTITSTFTPSRQGTHSVKVNQLTGTFNIVPDGMHTLTVRKNGAAADFTIDGKSCKTPYSALLNVGTHTIVMPPADPTGEYTFLEWEDHSKNPTRKINLRSKMSIYAYYSGGSSCPSLYIWNGTSYVYVAEVSNHGWLGYINYVTGDPDWPIVYWRNNPWDYIPLDKTQLQLRNGYYDMTLIQRWNEIFYLDAAYMLVVDHPSDVNVYSTMVEQYLDPAYMGKIYTVSKNPLKPISAFNEKGENVLPQILEIDGVFTSGINGIQSPSWDNILWNRLTLDLGDLSDAEQIKLIVRGVVDWGSADDYTTWIDKFFASDVPAGTQITPAPYMEVKNATGHWVRVPESRQFPIPPDSAPRTFVVDLTGLFLTDDYSLRINNFWNVTFDYIGIDTSSQTNVTIQEIYPYANLYQVFSTGSAASGNFTRYGDVTQLVLNPDDMFVIGKQGDAVSLLFPVDTTPLAEGMERDFFLYVSLWFKDETGNWGYGFEFTVDPLPFYDMSGFPYPLETESYPYDDEHLWYLSEYNTRTITAP